MQGNMSEIYTKEEHRRLLRRALHMWLPIVSENTKLST